MKNRIRALFLLALLVFSLSSPVSAVDYPDDGVGFWKMMSGWVGVRALKAFLDVPDSDATDEDWENAYNLYLDELKNQIGTTVLTNGGLRLYPTFLGYDTSLSSATDVSSTGTNPFMVSGLASKASRTISISFASITVPFGGTLTRVQNLTFENGYISQYIGYPSEQTQVVSGSSVISSVSATIYSNDVGSFSCGGSYFYELYPTTGVIDDYFNIDLSNDVRFGSLSNRWAYQGDNGFVTVDNSQLFDESTNTFYNPATNETVNVTDWNYDYSDRSYGITLGDGRIGKIVYGDESASVNLQDSNGNTITYNYYYTSPDGSGGGSGGDGGSDGDSIWDKLGELLGAPIKAVIGMIESLLSKVLDGLIALVDMMAEKLQAVVTGILELFDAIPLMFGGFLEFLGSAFTFLPPEIMSLLFFGLFAIILVGFVKLILK